MSTDEVFPGDGSQTRDVLEQALRLGSGEHPVEPSAETVAQEFGTDWMATTVLGIAVWVALYAESRARVSSGLARHILLDAYTQAISVDSDSDSIGSVMGSLVALCFQLGNLVEPQIKRVRGLDEVQAVAERFLTQLGL
ncbi:MAG: ADP-ribosylglycohydrolase family protein [Rothia dentocariosa]